MLTHKQVWEGIDRLAESKNLSASALAKRAGLDPTTFNKSKRITKQGKARWPSTESLSKVLDATSTSIGEFVGLVVGDQKGYGGAGQRIRCIRFGQLKSGAGLDSAGFPSDGPWENVDFPSVEDPHAYMIELDSDLAPPFYRAGDLVVVSPSSSIRRNDRVIIMTRSGQLRVGVLTRRTAERVSVILLDGTDNEEGIETGNVSWIGRILWVSQ